MIYAMAVSVPGNGARRWWVRDLGAASTRYVQCAEANLRYVLPRKVIVKVCDVFNRDPKHRCDVCRLWRERKGS